MLDTVVHHPTEGKVLVEGAVTDTLRRLRDGDPLAGWEGDSNMQLFADLDTGLFDVWTLDVAGNPTIVVERRPHCDYRLIEDVVRADTRRFDVAQRIIDTNTKVQADRDAWAKDERDELADRLHLALLKDNGAMYGGLSRRIF